MIINEYAERQGISMSTRERTIGYYFFNFRTKRKAQLWFDQDLFKNLLKYINNLSPENRIIRIERIKKAIAIDNITLNRIGNREFLSIVFKNCKYNHSPEYMSSIDGTERPSDKALYEGEKEKTHLLFQINNL